MPKQYPYKLVLSILKKNGFFYVSQTGSHIKYRKEGNPTKNVIIPIHEKDLRYGTFRSILRQSGLKEDDFIKKKY